MTALTQLSKRMFRLLEQSPWRASSEVVLLTQTLSSYEEKGRGEILMEQSLPALWHSEKRLMRYMHPDIADPSELETLTEEAMKQLPLSLGRWQLSPEPTGLPAPYRFTMFRQKPRMKLELDIKALTTGELYLPEGRLPFTTEALSIACQCSAPQEGSIHLIYKLDFAPEMTAEAQTLCYNASWQSLNDCPA